MSKLTRQDLALIVSRLPRDVVKNIKNRGLILGGGFVRATISGEEPSDIDLFAGNKDQLEAAARSLVSDRNGAARIHESKNAFTVVTVGRLSVQYIFRWVFDHPTECIRSFDFTVAQGAIWFEKSSEEFKDGVWRSVCAPTFYSDLAAKRLVYTSPDRNEDAGGSMLRVRKFLSRGYNIQAPSLAFVIARIACAVKWEKVACAVKWEKVASEEVAAEIICGLLREVDPAVAIDGLPISDEVDDVEES